MEALIANRKVRRTQLTKLVKKIDAALNPHNIEDPPVSLVTLERYKVDAQDKVTLLIEVHEAITQASGEDDIDQLIDEQDNFLEPKRLVIDNLNSKICLMKATALPVQPQNIVANIQSLPSISANEESVADSITGATPDFKLPKLELYCTVSSREFCFCISTLWFVFAYDVLQTLLLRGITAISIAVSYIAI